MARKSIAGLLTHSKATSTPAESLNQRHQETRDQAHVVIKRQPTDNYVIFVEGNRVGVAGKLIEDGAVREGDAFCKPVVPLECCNKAISSAAGS